MQERPKRTTYPDAALQKLTKRFLHTQKATRVNESDSIWPAYEEWMEKLHKVRQSKNPQDKISFAEKDTSKYYEVREKVGVPTDFTHVLDTVDAINTLNPPSGVSFKARLDSDLLNMVEDAKGAVVTFTLTHSFRQRLDVEALSKLPKGVYPAAGVNIWTANVNGKQYPGASFLATNSQGRERDATLGPQHSTGALTNRSPGGVGEGNIEMWLRDATHPLTKLSRTLKWVAGLSQGAALAIRFREIMLAEGLEPFGYFNSAPRSHTPPSQAWISTQDKVLFVESSQDLITETGIYPYPGREIVPPVLGLPAQPGIGNKPILEGLVTQHAVQPNTLVTNRDHVVPRPGLRTGIEAPNYTDDAAYVPWLLDELRIRYGTLPFSPGRTENKMLLLLDRFGLADHVPAGEPLGREVAENMILASELSETVLFTKALKVAPEATLIATLASRKAIKTDVEAGLNKLAKHLMYLIEQEDVLPPNDLSTKAADIAAQLGMSVPAIAKAPSGKH